MNDVVQESYTANMFTPQVQINTLYADSSLGPKLVGTITTMS